MIIRVFSTRKVLFLNKLFTAYIKPILKYAGNVLNLTCHNLKRDIVRVQRHFTKRLRSLRFMSYEQRLYYLRQDKLAWRRHADLATAFKTLRGM